jgi:hypothetical protein
MDIKKIIKASFFPVLGLLIIFFIHLGIGITMQLLLTWDYIFSIADDLLTIIYISGIIFPLILFSLMLVVCTWAGYRTARKYSMGTGSSAFVAGLSMFIVQIIEFLIGAVLAPIFLLLDAPFRVMENPDVLNFVGENMEISGLIIGGALLFSFAISLFIAFVKVILATTVGAIGGFIGKKTN